jgi:hypothetical protein
MYLLETRACWSMVTLSLAVKLLAQFSLKCSTYPLGSHACTAMKEIYTTRVSAFKMLRLK